jgi:hypothetical protein
MFATHRWTRRLLLAPLAITGALLVGCDDDGTEPEDDPADAIEEMRLTIGSGTVTIDRGGNVSGGPVTIAAGATVVTAVFLDDEGATVGGLDEFELRVTPTNTGIMTWQSTSAFSGTLTHVSAGSTTVGFALYHIEEMHEDFGPFDVSITAS